MRARRLRARLDERDRLVAAEVGDDEVGLPLVERFQFALEFGELEEPVLLFDPVERDSWIGQALPSATSRSVLKSAQRGQYQPS